MEIRPATKLDTPQMVALAEEKRVQYEIRQPVFWCRASNASDLQASYFESLLTKDQHVVLV